MRAASILIGTILATGCGRAERVPAAPAWDPRSQLTVERIRDALQHCPGEFVAGVQEVVDDSDCYGPKDGSACGVEVRIVEYLAGEPGRPRGRQEGWTYRTMEMRMEEPRPQRAIGRRRLVLACPSRKDDLWGNLVFVVDPTEGDVERMRQALRDVAPRWPVFAEGLTSSDRVTSIEAARRMFTVPNLDELCAGKEHAVSLEHVGGPLELEVGEATPLSALRVVALDARGEVIPAVPIAIEVEDPEPPILRRASDDEDVNASRLRPLRPGTFRIAVRTTCGRAGAATVLTATVHP